MSPRVLGSYAHLLPYRVPDYYFGSTWYGYYVAAGRSRDSSLLELSNFDAMLAIVGGETDEDDEGIADVTIARASHFLCGWIETLYIHERRIDLCSLADKALARLENYPILDEDDLSIRENDAACTAWQQATIAERVRIIGRYGSRSVSVFSARRSEFPADDNGNIFDYLRGN